MRGFDAGMPKPNGNRRYILFPVITEFQAGAILRNVNITGSDQLKGIADNLEKALKIPVANMDEEGMKEQVDNLINFLS